MYSALNEVQLHALARGDPVFPAPSVLPIDGLGTPVKNDLTICVRADSWALDSILLAYESVFVPMPHSFGHCSFTVSFKIRKGESSSFVSFSRLFGYSGCLEIPNEFSDGFLFLLPQKAPRLLYNDYIFNISCLYILLNLQDALQFQEENSQMLNQNP